MTKPTVYLGADHAGFDMKTSIREHLELKGYIVHDLGASKFNPEDDYPVYGELVAEAVLNHPRSFGILSCGSAEGIAIVANKFDGIRAGIGYNIASAQTMRSDDNANIIAIPGRIEIEDDPLTIVDIFLETSFSKARRHKRRIKQIEKIEISRDKNIKIIPAILTKSKKELADKLLQEDILSLADYIQVDILDGSMFNNISFADPLFLNKIDNNIELHLMIQNPLDVITQWKNLVPNFTRTIIHAEINQPIEPLVKAIKSLNLEVGVALNPETPIEKIFHIIPFLDVVVIMGVYPGKSGQKFIGEKILHKISVIRKKFPETIIAVDGGVKQNNAKKIILAGANQLYVASEIWKSSDPTATFQNLKNVLQSK